jgi:hypothetical protein
MRYVKQIPCNGDRRSISKFLWLPLNIKQIRQTGDSENSFSETRWLATAKISQEYWSVEKKWKNIKFLD